MKNINKRNNKTSKEEIINQNNIIKTNLPFSEKSNLLTMKKWVIAKLIIFVILSTICLVGLFFSSSIERLINFDYFASSVLEEKQSKVHFIDVGQGDCSVIELPSGEIAMIDTGPTEKWEKINTYFEYLKIPKKIDYLILTHTDNDHIGNAEKILENYEVKNIYIPKVYSAYEVKNNLAENKNYKILNNLVWNNVCSKMHSILTPDQINYNESGIIITDNIGYTISFLSPFDDYFDDDNKYSPIILCSMRMQQVLFMGDADSEIEKQFLEEYSAQISNNILNITLLKVGHHGSKTSTSKEFVDSLKPKMAVISCGKDNSYGHPANETINTLSSVINTKNIYRTDVSNSIMFYAEADFRGFRYGVKYEYENFDNFYCKFWYVSVTIIILSFSSLIMPMLLSKKIKLLKYKNEALQN